MSAPFIIPKLSNASGSDGIAKILLSHYEKDSKRFHAAVFAHFSLSPTLSLASTSPAPSSSDSKSSPQGNESSTEVEFHCVGATALSASSPPITADSIFWLASLGKIITVVAVLKCIELFPSVLPLGLDADVTPFLPAICSTIVNEDLTLTQAKHPITLRSLLTHTSGLAYEIVSPLLVQWKESQGQELFLEGNFTGTMDPYRHPLVFEPGTSWAYGPGVDWAGRIVERVSGVSLEEFLTEWVLRPLGIEGEMSFRPEKNIPGFVGRKVDLVTKNQTTGLLENEREELVYPGDAKECLGGIGLSASPRAYMAVLRMLMVNDGSVLSRESVEEIFKGQVENTDTAGYLNALLNSEYMVQSGMKDALSKGGRVEGGLGCFVGFEHHGAGSSMRGEGTISGMGLPNCSWWVDREKGVARAMFLGRTPALDGQLAGMVGEVETGIYGGL